MKSNTGKRKCEDVDEINERRVTRSMTSGLKSSSSTNPINTIYSASIEIDDDVKPPPRPIGIDSNYCECEICDKVGRLLCCESCPRAYHLKCLGLEVVPEGEWQCPSCCYDFSKPIKYLLRDYASIQTKPAAQKLKYSSAASSLHSNRNQLIHSFIRCGRRVEATYLLLHGIISSNFLLIV